MFSSNTTQESGGYQIQRSLRFNSADSANLTRTFGSINSSTFTYSLWVKRGKIGVRQDVLGGALIFTASDIIIAGLVSGSDILDTTQVFRDPSAWYHIVMAMDTTQATASNRLKLYINGQQVTSFSIANYPSQNSTTDLSTSGLIGYGSYGGSQYFDGYMTEVNFIDGQALTPSSFGEINADTGVWQPKRYGGSYGTNGFYLNFSDNSNTTAATLGADYSGNGNNWTPNNFSVAAGVGNDSLVDVPTNWGVDTGVGGSVRGNYCTLNPLDSAITLSNGNLDYASDGSGITKATMGMSSGKWYWECVWRGTTGGSLFGIASESTPSSTEYLGLTATAWSYYINGVKYNNGSSSSYGASYTTNDVIGVALDMDAGTLVFYKNGVSQGTAASGLTGVYFPAAGNSDVNDFGTFNFGQRPFAYTAPSGFKALNTQNLPTPTIGATPTTQAGKFFNPVLYTGNGSTNAVTGVGFQPDLVWIKQRSATRNHNLYDAVRGVLKVLQANVTDAEVNYSSSLTSFDSDGFSLGTATDPNANGGTYVAWNWKANGAGVTNTTGSITSTASANTTSGFSVVTYTGSGVAGTIGHGLGAAPAMVIVKSRSATGDWPVYHASLGNGSNLLLNSTAASASSATIWNSTSPTSSVFSVGINTTSNTVTVTYVAYAFAEVPGYSKFGSYTGNSSLDGPFVFCGFRPAYVMFKRTDVANDWNINDATRSEYNQTANVLAANLSSAENTTGTGNSIDILSNGFKLRQSNQGSNANGGTYIFAAFAESPFKYSLAR
jgi:hypothetical protein